MKKVITAGIVGLFAMLFSGIALADDLTITFTVPEVSSMTTDVGDGITFILVQPVPPGDWEEVTDTFTISVSDNTGNPMKVTVNTSADVPSGITITADASAGLGTPATEIPITNIAKDLISDIESECGSSTVTLGLSTSWDSLAAPATSSSITLVVTYCEDS
jgi:hypothetical protein